MISSQEIFTLLPPIHKEGKHEEGCNEEKHFESFAAEVDKNPQTVISREYSVEWEDGMEPYYPVNNDKNNALYKQYEALAAKEKNVIFGGRLAEYKYYDMAPIVEKVLDIFGML